MKAAQSAIADALGPKYDVVGISHSSTKPGIPLLLPIALLLWTACAVCYNGFRLVDSGTLGFIGIASALACLACAIAAAILGRRLASILAAAAVLAGAALGAYGAYQVSFAEQNFTGTSQVWEFALIEDAKAGAYGYSAAAEATGENGMRAKVRLNLSDDSALLQGEIISAKATLTPPSETSAEYFWSRGMSASANVSSYDAVPSSPPLAAIQQIRASAIDVFAEYGGSQAGLLQALVCGYRNTIQDSGEYELYKVAGLAHLVAVSGAHLAIVTMLLGWFLKKIRLPCAFQSLFSIAFVLAYLVFSGVPISALRAAFMVALSTTAFFAKRRAASLNSLAFCIVLFLVLDPSIAVSVSFFLSAGSTLGIVLFAGLISSWFTGMPDKARKIVAEPLGLTLASNIVTLPYSAALFSQIPLLAPVANILAAPLFSLACVSGLLSACISVAAPVLAKLAVRVACVCVTPLSAVVGCIASVPYACIPVVLPVHPMVALSAAACLALWIAWPKLKARALAYAAFALCAAMFAAVFIAPRLSGDELIMLDVGQGDAILIRSGGSTVLVDTGNQEAKLKENLGKLGVYRIDAVVISHHDDDHMGCLDDLAEYEDVGAVYSAEDALDCACDNCGELRHLASVACGAGLKGLGVGDSIKVGAFELTVVWPESYTDEGGNGDSVCLLLKADCDSDGILDWQALLTGDVESDQLEGILKSKLVGDIDILKIGHHGSKVALTEDTAEALRPEVALISCGANNRYGHPKQEALDVLEGVAAQVYRTDKNGTIKVTFTADKMLVEPEISR